MASEEIQERNKQIALMLGWTHNKFMNRWNDEDIFHKYAYVEELKFHSDWNWLMEAVEFIEGKDYWVEIVKSQLGTKTRNYPIIWCEIGKENSTDLLDDNCYTKITRGESVNRNKKEAVFIAVSDFAKLYNEKKI